MQGVPAGNRAVINSPALRNDTSKRLDVGHTSSGKMYYVEHGTEETCYTADCNPLTQS